MASALNFKLQVAENSASNLIRRGTLSFTKKNQVIQTPACLTYSLRGAVPHLVADNLKLLPIELVQISLEQLYVTFKKCISPSCLLSFLVWNKKTLHPSNILMVFINIYI
jgi:hypothetical protein